MASFLMNLKTHKKLMLGVTVCNAFTIFLGSLAIAFISSGYQNTKTEAGDCVRAMNTVNQIESGTRRLRVLEYQDLIATSPARQAFIETEMLDAISDVNEGTKSYSYSSMDPADSQNLQSFISNWNVYLSDHNNEFIPDSRAKNHNAALSLLDGKMEADFDAATSQIDAVTAWNAQHVDKLNLDAHTRYLDAVWGMAALLLAFVISSHLGVKSLAKYITSTLSVINSRLETLSTIDITSLHEAVIALENGDLTPKVSHGTRPLYANTSDEFGDIARSFNLVLSQTASTIDSFAKSQESLKALVCNLQETSSKVAIASQSVSGIAATVNNTSTDISTEMAEVESLSDQSAKGASEVASGSVYQSKVICNVNDMMNLLRVAVRGVASDSQIATEASERAQIAASSGADAVQQTILGMSRLEDTVTKSAEVITSLSEQSKQITAIVGTIAQLADQTNLLALNAAIEAARAGEAGRGFGVVAQAVRALAERSRLATQDISSIILAIQERADVAADAMERGCQEVQSQALLARNAGDSLEQIKVVATEVSAQVSGIGLATVGMLQDADQVAAKIEEITSIIEESCAVASEMSMSAIFVSVSVQNATHKVSRQSSSATSLVESAEHLRVIAETLKDSTDQFKIDDPTVHGIENSESNEVKLDMAA